MNSQPGTEITINIDGRTIVAQPHPEDQATLAELIGRGASFTLQQSDADTEGHALANEIAVDVEGHAMTLRLPTAGDAAAIRRALAVGAVTATLVIGGAFAASTIHPQTQSPAISVPRAPAAQAAPMTVSSDEGLADQASQAASAEFAQSRAGAGAVSLPVNAVPGNPTTTGDGSDQDINLAERGRQGAANQAPQPGPPPPSRDGGSHPE